MPSIEEKFSIEKERNLEKDQRSFLEAIAETQISEIKADFDETSLATLDSELEKSKLFLLGEIHGVRENPQIIYTLFKKFGFRNLALEWDSSLKEVAEGFLKSGTLDFNALKNSPDGRITAGHFALLKKLREEGLLDELVCFDQGGGGGWDERDALMAKNILTRPLHTKTLVVAGNLHTQTQPVFIENEEHHPLGENLKKQIPNILSGKIQYSRGEYHNFGRRKITENPGKPAASEFSEPRFYKSEDGTYVFTVPEAQAATVPNPSETLE